MKTKEKTVRHPWNIPFDFQIGYIKQQNGARPILKFNLHFTSIGPAKEAQLLMVRSLIGRGKKDFKFPLYLDYDLAITKELFNR